MASHWVRVSLQHPTSCCAACTHTLHIRNAATHVLGLLLLFVCAAPLGPRTCILASSDRTTHLSKQVFMSCHNEVILVATVMHPARVFFLPSEEVDKRVWEAGSTGGHFQPGFICRR